MMAVVVAVALVVAALIAADRVLALLAARVVARRVAVMSQADSSRPARRADQGGRPPRAPRGAVRVKIAGAPFVTQLIAGRYQDVELALAAFTGAGLDFTGLTARLTGVLAPLRKLLANGDMIAGEVNATVVVPFRALARRLPSGLEVQPHGTDLRIVGSLLRMPVSGTLGIKAEPRQISLTPKVAGVPALVGFVIALPAMPPQLAIASVRVTPDGLEVSVHGRDVKLPEPQRAGARLSSRGVS